MKITTQGEYGLRCVLNIARGRDEPVTIEEICVREKISQDYAEQLLMRLRRAGIVESQKGPGGGYVLGSSAKKIKVKDVILALETNPFETICVRFKKKKRVCVNADDCKVKILWKKLARETERVLSEVTIADLV
jgi:Rrf2 family protein